MNQLKNSYLHGFIGIGRMGQAMLKGLLDSGAAKPAEILVSQPFPEELKAVKKLFRVTFTQDNLQVARRCRFIWLGVKPFQAEEVLRGIGPTVGRNAHVISFMTGVSVAFLRHYLGRGPKIIRLMPNTPCLLGVGMTGVYFSREVGGTTQNMILKILKGLGATEVVSREGDLDAVTGLSGSGPAFVYALAQGFIQGGIRSGLKNSAARKLAYQTLLGASRMLLETGHPPEELIRHVATKGGTTEAGLRILEERAAAAMVEDAVRRATERAREIREENDRCLP